MQQLVQRQPRVMAIPWITMELKVPLLMQQGAATRMSEHMQQHSKFLRTWWHRHKQATMLSVAHKCSIYNYVQCIMFDNDLQLVRTGLCVQQTVTFIIISDSPTTSKRNILQRGHGEWESTSCEVGPQLRPQHLYTVSTDSEQRLP